MSEIKKSIAEQVMGEIPSNGSTSDIRDTVASYTNNSKVVGMTLKEKTTLVLFTDSSILIYSINEHNKEIGIILPENMLNIIANYYPFDGVATKGVKAPATAATVTH